MLYIMRHGQTDWNKLHKLQGQTDIELNDTGRNMARDAAKLYKDVHFDVCFCSPLVRAVETAKLVLEGRDIPISYDDRLKEMNFGIYEGIEESFSIPDCPINVVFKDPANYKAVENGESLEDVFARTGDILENEIMPLVNAGKDVLIIGHGAMNSTIICQIRGLDKSHLWDEPIENCRLVKLI